MNQPDQKTLEVWQWWAVRVKAGHQLRDLDEWMEDFDYKQPDQHGWCVSVATEVLCAEYNREHSDRPYDHIGFTPILRRILVESRLSRPRVSMEMGGSGVRMQRRFLLFKPRYWYETRLHNESYYACFR